MKKSEPQHSPENKPMEKYKLQRPPQSRGKLPLPLASVNAFGYADQLNHPPDSKQRTDDKQKEYKPFNIGLYFDRYIQFADETWQMDYKLPKLNNKPGQDSFNAKIWNLQKIVNTHIERNQPWGSIFEAAYNRWQQTVKSQHAEPFTLTPEWRFVTGLGEKNALENGFTFHRIYGFPIIHGSTLKGLARAVALSEIADTLKVKRLGLSEAKGKSDKKEKTPLQVLDEWLLQSDEKMIEQTKYEVNQTQRDLVQQFRHVFGTKESAGLAMFFDAMPAEAPKLEVDVMNVHYPEYYGEKSAKPPTDNQNPNPIPFLTLGRTPFYFAVGWRGVMVDNTLQTQAQTWLKTGLTEFGVGAKTATGYGYFGE